MKILIIDDDILMRHTVAKILLADGHDVVTAAEGSQGIAVYRQEKPELVITDIVMPEQEGLETILALRRDETPVKIIVVSGSGAEMLETARLLGADAVVEKPFRMHALVELIHSMQGRG